MSKYSLAHLSDSALLSGTTTLVERDRATTAELIAHLAEVDDRGLYLPEGYPSLYEWCVRHLRFSRDSACKRIRAARAARLYPAIFPMLADGRLTLSAVVMLAGYLTTGNAADLLSAAAGRTNEEVERLIAERFPRTDVLALITSLGATAPSPATTDEGPQPSAPREQNEEVAARPLHVPVRSAFGSELAARARLTPIAAGRYALQATITQETFDALEYAKSLLGHAVPSGDLAQVLDRALKVFVAHLEKERFAKCARSGPSRRRGTSDPRSIPAAVRRLVWERDGGKCTFVGENDTHCESRTRLEFDHIEPVARGGQSTPANLRLRCRAHNQLAAERAFGRAFMRHQREEAKQRAMREREARRAAEAKAREATRERDAATADAHASGIASMRDDVVKALRNLGYSAAESREAARVVDQMPGASLEHLLRAALKSLLPRSVRIERYGSAPRAHSSGVGAGAFASGS